MKKKSALSLAEHAKNLLKPIKRTKRLSGNKHSDKMLKTLEKKKKPPAKKR